MFGYACRETPDLMPAPIYYAHKILELLAEARKNGEGDATKLGPDSKSQVTVRYVDGKPTEVTQIVLSTQHLDESWDSAKVRSVVEPYILEALGDLPVSHRLQMAHQSHRQVRHRRTGWRCRPDRSENHR